MMSSCPLSLPLALLTAAARQNEYTGLSFNETPTRNPSNDSFAAAIVAESNCNNVVRDNSASKSRYVAPSKVIHLRNVPNEASDAEIIALGSPFGLVTNVLLLKGKNQAFLEMANKACASKVVAAFISQPPYIRGRVIYAQFSNHRELKIDQNNVCNVSSDCRLRPSFSGSSSSSSMGGNGTGCNGNSTGSTDPSSVFLHPSPSTSAGSTGSPSNSNSQQRVNAATSSVPAGGSYTVLRAIVERLLYPVSLETFQQIFSRYGKVLKIVLFRKNNAFQALIEFSDPISAQRAQMSLNGQNIYNGCCTLRIDFSKLSTLNIKYNNSKSRDFTNPSLPPGENGTDIIQTQVGLVNANNLLLLTGAGRQPPNRLNMNTASGANPALNNVTVNSNPNEKLVNLIGIQNQLAASPALGFGLDASFPAPIFGNGVNNLSGLPFANVTALNAALLSTSYGLTNVLFVVNLNEEYFTPDALFILFGAYGDVERVKILYNKRDSALIQMKELHQSYLAIFHLDRLRLFGKTMRVMSSKHQSIQLPREGQPDAGLTREYAGSSLHRFKKPFSKNYHNIYPPSSTLHLSNIPPSCTEEDIKSAFVLNRFDVKSFNFFPNDHKMALLELGSVEEAVLALIRMHNHELSESSHLRVSFAKSRTI